MRASSVFAGCVLLTSVAFAAAREAGGEAPVLALEIDRVEVALDFGRRVVDAEAEYLIGLDPSVVAADPDVLSLDMYRETRLEARRFKTRVYDGWMSWSGDLYFPDALGPDLPAGYILLVNHGDRVSGVLNVLATGDEFQILGSPGGEHRLVRMKRERRTSCGVNLEGIESEYEAPSADAPATSGTQAPLAGQGPVEIDVLALIMYDQDSPQTRDFIQTSVALANLAFDQSEVAATYNLIGPHYLSYAECWFYGCLGKTTVSDYLVWMNSSIYIEMKRNQYSADMVALFVQPGVADPCGRANLPYKNPAGQIRFLGGAGQDLPWTDEAYSVHTIGCGLNDLTFAHELGHNYGLRHDNNDPWDPDPFHPQYQPIDQYPRGHIFWTTYGQRATVMGCVPPYSGDPFAGVCDRLLYYSDPNIWVPMWGVEPTGSYQENAAAAEALRDRVQEYSLFR